MIPTRPEISAAPAAPSLPPVPRRAPSRSAPRPARPSAHADKLAPRLTTPAPLALPPRPTDFTQRPHPPPAPCPPPRPPMPFRLARPCPSASPAPQLSAGVIAVGCRVPSTTRVSHRPHHAFLSPLAPQPDGHLSLEHFSERGGVAAGVSGGREDDAAERHRGRRSRDHLLADHLEPVRHRRDDRHRRRIRRDELRPACRF